MSDGANRMKNLRIYGSSPFKIAVLHGGPGAPGEMAPVARELSSIKGVLEPLQLVSPLEGQVQELHTVLKEAADVPVILVGWSWGAMLGFVFTARYPSMVSKLILISSGVYEDKYAADIMRTRLSRLDEAERAEVTTLMQRLEDPDVENGNRLLERFGELMTKADSYALLPYASEVLEFHYEIYQRVWQEAVEMRSSGELLRLGKQIECPVVAIHGDYDPHPAASVAEPLTRVLKDFRFILLENCGHYPWYERAAREPFFSVLKKEVL